MDPWVWTQIRLAERQGLLTGRGLSATQVTAVYLCEVRDQRQSAEEKLEAFKYALLSTGHISVEALFPDLFTKEVNGEEADLGSEEDQVTYKFDEIDMSESDVERELAQLMAGGDMTVRGSELG